MRKLKSHHIAGASVQAVLEVFNERANELGIFHESNLVSVSILPGDLDGTDATVALVIVYWADE